MMEPHLGSVQEQIAVVLPRPRGGIAPSRREVALADYIEKQGAHRLPERLNPGMVLWGLIHRAGLALPVLSRWKRAAARTEPHHCATASHRESTVGDAYGRS